MSSILSSNPVPPILPPYSVIPCSGTSYPMCPYFFSPILTSVSDPDGSEFFRRSGSGL